jgi:precorrin-8X/cobalt-precorrin-8 methylmutase
MGDVATTARPLVDVVIVVDWSAAAAPKTGADSIWSHELGDGRAELTNHPTRAAARVHLTDRLQHLVGRRVLVGFDFAFAYPAGFAAAAGLDPTVNAWLAVWQHLAEHIVDDDRNHNNRWEVAASLNERLGSPHFWGVPTARASEHLSRTKPRAFALPEFRRSEHHLHETTGRRPFSAWQLLGAGAVGSQTLMGIPTLHHLRHTDGLSERTRVWPFETGFTADPWSHAPTDGIVLAEVWPSAIDSATIDLADHPTKDARQMLTLGQSFMAAAADGSLSAAFDGPTDPADRAAAAEEGWVLTPGDVSR